MRKGRKRQKLMPMWNEGPLIPALVGPAFLSVTWNASSPFLHVCLSGSWRQTGGRTFPLLFSSVNSDGDLKCSWLENCTRRSKSENIPRLPGKSPILTTLGRSVLGHLNDFNYRKISEYKLHRAIIEQREKTTIVFATLCSYLQKPRKEFSPWNASPLDLGKLPLRCGNW